MAHKQQPFVIGLTSTHGDQAWLNKNSRNYLNMLANAGVHVVILAPDVPAVMPDGAAYAPDASGRMPEAVLDHLSGLVASGGGDVHPKYFGQELNGAETEHISLERDEMELGLLRAALERDLPIFGICRGAQVLNVAAGGSLRQHLDGHRSPNDQTAYHQVDILLDTGLRRIVGSASISVNTFHHQGISQNNIAPGFVVAGLADPDNWLIEAYESPRHRWVRGVQWHPERIFELEASHQLIWDSFIRASRETSNNGQR